MGLKSSLVTQAKKKGLKMDFVDYGIASRIRDTIIMNKNLLKNEKLCKSIFDHELRHTNKCTKKDFMMDLFEGSFIDNMTFCLRYPLGFSQFIPFGKYKGKLFIDINEIIVYSIMGIIIFTFIKLI